MPELADVEGFRRVLAEHVGRRIVDVEVRDAGVLRGTSAPALRSALRGRRFTEPWRHGNDRVVFVLDDSALRYRDMRKLTGIHLGREESDVDALLADLGPDAASVSREAFVERLSRRRRQLKPALMDQGVLAGLGNLLVDEILWRARLHPGRRTAELDQAALSGLHARMRSVLRTAARHGEVPARRSWLTGHREDDNGRCPRCGARLEHNKISGRAPVWCPHCQPRAG